MNGNKPKSHIAFVSPGFSGHINPTLPIVRELVNRGHRITYATEVSAAEHILQAGAEVVGYKFRPAESIVINSPEAAARSTLALLKEVEQALPEIEAAYDSDRPDVIVNDWLAWAGPMLAAKWGVPRIQSWSAFPASEGYDFRQFIGDMFAAAPAVEAEFGSLLTTVLDRHGIPAFKLHDFFRPAELNLVYQPKSFPVHNKTFDDRYVFVGPTRLPAPNDWTPPGRPLVLVSMGTGISNPDLFRTCIQAFADQPYRVVLALGRSIDQDDLGFMPANIEAHVYVPQTEVLAHADVFITHAGMNSTMEALAAAVPMVAIPHTLEEQTTADRVSELGLGIALAPTEATAA